MNEDRIARLEDAVDHVQRDTTGIKISLARVEARLDALVERLPRNQVPTAEVAIRGDDPNKLPWMAVLVIIVVGGILSLAGAGVLLEKLPALLGGG